MKKQKSRFLGGATVLALGSVVAKIIGAVYRVPLTNILGAEGMGMYQLVFPVFALFMVLSSAGIPTALSRIVAEKRALGLDTKKYLYLSLTVLSVLSAVFSIIVFFASDAISASQGNSAVAIGYKLISPSILFVGIIAGFRGWFQGERYMLPTALSNVVEQVVKLAVGLTLAVYMSKRGAVYAVEGAILGVTASEGVALVYLLLTYFVREKKKGRISENLKITKDETKEMMRVAVPIAMVALLIPLSNFFDSLIIVNVLKSKGTATEIATAEYGLLSGPVSSLINLPVVTIMSLAVAVVPSVSVSRVRHDVPAIMSKSALSLKLSFAIGVPTAVFMMIFAREIIGTLYPSLSSSQLDVAQNLLVISSSNIVLNSAMQIYVSLLQALDKTKNAVLSIVCAIVVKVCLSVLLVRFIGINGGAVASVAFGAVALVACCLSFTRLTGLRLEDKVGRIFICGAVAGGVSLIPHYLIEGDIVCLVVGFVLNYIIYFYLMLLLGVLDEDELRSLPFGGVFGKLYKTVRFWECDDG